MEEAKKMVQLIGAVQYKKGFNYCTPEKVVLSDCTRDGTWAFENLDFQEFDEPNNIECKLAKEYNGEGLKKLIDEVYEKYISLSENYTKDGLTKYFIIATNDKQDCEFFLTLCGIPAATVKDTKYPNYKPPLYDANELLWHSDEFEECLKKIWKVGSFLKMYSIKRVTCNLFVSENRIKLQ